MSYLAKDAGVQSQQLTVQTLTIPFTVTHSATAANVLLRNDQPSILFLESSAVDQITPELAVNETATYTTGPTDSTGTLDALLVINENVTKVVKASVTHRNKVSQSGQGAYLGSATGITTGTAGGQKVMIVLTCGVNILSTDVDAVLEVTYETQQ